MCSKLGAYAMPVVVAAVAVVAAAVVAGSRRVEVVEVVGLHV